MAAVVAVDFKMDELSYEHDWSGAARGAYCLCLPRASTTVTTFTLSILQPKKPVDIAIFGTLSFKSRFVIIIPKLDGEVVSLGLPCTPGERECSYRFIIYLLTTMIPAFKTYLNKRFF